MFTNLGFSGATDKLDAELKKIDLNMLDEELRKQNAGKQIANEEQNDAAQDKKNFKLKLEL